MAQQDKLAIVVGGGPAPGINSVIGAASIRANLSGIGVVGILDGFQWLMAGRTDQTTPLTTEAVSRIHFRGGSVLRTARANPTKDPKHLAAVVDSLDRLGVDKLISIGGDDTAFSAMKVSAQAGGRIRVVHVPKTIDNDLDLPEGIPTFGYQTARHVGVGIVRDLLVDARTTSRWYLVVTMGRKAGHLALGIGKAAGATVTLIPEEFAGQTKIPLSHMVDIIAGAIIKRRAAGRLDGVAVVAEGLVEYLSEDDLGHYAGAERDEHGHIRISEVNFGDMLKRAVSERLQKLGVKATLVAKDIGYELRCCDPIPFDMEYTRDLGYCAAKFLLEGGSGAMVTVQNGVFKPLRFEEMLDPATGRTRVRLVNIDTEYFKIARRYMLRLRRDDFEDEAALAKFASAVGLDVAGFRKQFEYLVAGEAPPLRLSV